MKISALIVLAFLGVTAHSQTSINSYKYVLLPQRFSFLKTDDQYGLNSTAKSLLEQKGFTVLWSSGNLPASVAANKCTALMADVSQRRAMFSTNLTVELKDCSGNILFKSKEGKSREKEFFIAYDAALRDAFSSLNGLPYKYDSSLSAQSQPQPTPATATAPATTPATTPPPANASPGNATPTSLANPGNTTPTNPGTAPAALPASAAAPTPETLYAQPIPNGYQLVDTSPKKVLTLLKTSLPDYYLAQSETDTGVVFKKEGEWLFEYYKDDKLVSRRLGIKF